MRISKNKLECQKIDIEFYTDIIYSLNKSYVVRSANKVLT